MTSNIAKQNCINHTQIVHSSVSTVFKEGIRAFKADGRTFDVELRSIISNYRSTPQSTKGVTPSELMIGRRFKMPVDLLEL